MAARRRETPLAKIAMLLSITGGIVSVATLFALISKKNTATSTATGSTTDTSTTTTPVATGASAVSSIASALNAATLI